MLMRCGGNYNQERWTLWHMFCNCIHCAKELARGLQAKLVCPLCHEDVTGLSLDFRTKHAKVPKKGKVEAPEGADDIPF